MRKTQRQKKKKMTPTGRGRRSFSPCTGTKKKEKDPTLKSINEGPKVRAKKLIVVRL